MVPDRVTTYGDFVAATLDEWGRDGGDAVLLLVSELTTNALLHARTTMTVTVTDEGAGSVLLAVADESAAVPRGRRFSAESATGRGLRLVESMSSAWGVEVDGAGKTVWCRVPLGASAWTSFDADSIEAL